MRTAFAGEVAAEVEDGIADKLAWAVIGYVTTAVDLMDLDATAGEEFVGGEDIGACCIATKREHRRMFEQEECVADDASLARCDHLGLEAQAFGIGNAAELEEMDVHGAI